MSTHDVRAFFAARKIECAIFAIGALLRLLLHWSFELDEGFDAGFHWGVVKWIAEHGTPAPRDLNCTAYNPSLYYLLAALPHALGAGTRGVQWASIAFGIAHLAVIWWGVEKFLKEWRLARIVALVVAATLPANLHIDGHITPETLSKLLCTLALVTGGTILASEDERARRTNAVWLGALLGFAFWTKVSVVALAPAFAVAALVDVIARRDLRRAAPLVLAAALGLLPAIPLVVDNQRACGHLLPTSFETHQKKLMDPIRDTPIWKRQPLHFFYGTAPGMSDDPYAPRGNLPAAQAVFFPVLVASTYVDYYNFRYVPIAKKKGEPPSLRKNNRPLRPLGFTLSQWSYRGGVWVSVATAAALLAALVVAARRRDAARLLLVLAPAFAVLSQLYFAVKYPLGYYGVIKGIYVQFGAAPLYALFGVAAAWLWSKRWGRPFAVGILLAYAPVVAYTMYARVGTWIYDVFM